MGDLADAEPTEYGSPQRSELRTREETVIDRVTGLMWQRTASDELSTEEAASYCAELELDGYCDFRVPTRIELVSLVDFTEDDPAIDATVFAGTEESSSRRRCRPVAPVHASAPTARRVLALTSKSLLAACAACVATSRVGYRNRITRSQEKVRRTPLRIGATRLTWQREFGSATYSFAEAKVLLRDSGARRRRLPRPEHEGDADAVRRNSGELPVCRLGRVSRAP